MPPLSSLTNSPSPILNVGSSPFSSRIDNDNSINGNGMNNNENNSNSIDSMNINSNNLTNGGNNTDLFERNFDAISWINANMPNDNEQTIDGTIKQLQDIKSRSISDHKKLIYRNYETILKINREFIELATDIQRMKGTTSQLKSFKDLVEKNISNENNPNNPLIQDGLLMSNASGNEGMRASMTLGSGGSFQSNPSLDHAYSMWINDIDNLTKQVACNEYEQAIETIDKINHSLAQEEATINNNQIPPPSPSSPSLSFPNSKGDNISTNNSVNVNTDSNVINSNIAKGGEGGMATMTISGSSSYNSQIFEIRNLLNNQIKLMTRSLLSTILIPQNRKSLVINVQLLTILGHADDAREYFLSGQSERIRSRSKDLAFHANLLVAISNLASITFDIIKKTASLFVDAFKDSKMTSGLIFWIKIQLRNFCSIAAKHVFVESNDIKMIAECIKICRTFSSELENVGLEFIFYIDQLFREPIEQILKKRTIQLEGEIQNVLMHKDNFTEILSDIDKDMNNYSQITISSQEFCRMIIEFLNDVEPLVSDLLSDTIIHRISGLFEAFFNALLKVSYRELAIQQYLMIIGNASFMVNKFLPSISSQLSKRFGKDFAELTKLTIRLELTIKILYDSLTEFCIKSWLSTQDDSFISSNYSNLTVCNADSVSNWLGILLPGLSKISREVSPNRRQSLVEAILIGITRQINELLIASTVTIDKSTSLTQFLLDIHVLMRACKQFQTQTSEHHIGVLCSKLLSDFKNKANNDEMRKMPTKDWLDEKTKEIINGMGKYSLDFGDIE